MSSVQPPAFSANLILACASREALATLEPHLEHFPLVFGDLLYDAHEVQRDVYFPTSGTVSLIYLMEDGSTAEIGVCGRDGAVGLFSCLPQGQTTSQSLVQADGQAFRVAGRIVRELANDDPVFAALLFAYAQVVWTQVSQTAVCNRRHTIRQQFCRWVLHTADLVGDEMQMTQQLMAEMLGVRREGVSAAASDLRGEGLIQYSRGSISLLDRKGMERRACECYAVVRKEIERLMPRPTDFLVHGQYESDAVPVN